jgi:hypothetical protein
MITDRLLVVSGTNNPGSAITGQGPITADANSTDVISLATVTTAIANNGGARDIGMGENLFMVFTVVIAFAGTGSVNLQVVTDDNEALSSPTVIGSTGAIAVASLTAGAQFVVAIPPRIASLGEQYLAARYTVASSPTTGTILAQIVEDVQDGRKFYRSGFSVA